MEASEKSRTRKRLSRRLGCWQDCREAREWSLEGAGGFGREAGGQPTKRPAWLHTQYGLFTPKPPGQAPRSPAHPPSSFSSLTFLSSHLRKQMGLRGEGGQSWEQERNALLVLFSHLRSQQERADSSRAPTPRPSSDGSPRTGFLISFLATLLGHCSLPGYPMSMAGHELKGVFRVLGNMESHSPGPNSSRRALFPGVADPGQNAQSLTEPNIEHPPCPPHSSLSLNLAIRGTTSLKNGALT